MEAKKQGCGCSDNNAGKLYLKRKELEEKLRERKERINKIYKKKFL